MAKQGGRGQATVRAEAECSGVVSLSVLFAEPVVGPSVTFCYCKALSATRDKMGNLPNSASKLQGDSR